MEQPLTEQLSFRLAWILPRTPGHAGTDQRWHSIVYAGGPTAGLDQRRGPKKALKDSIRAQQKGLCAYCDFPVGSWVARGTRPVQLKEHWDHFDPYEYIRANPSSNWIMACHICNGMKGKKCFGSIAGVRDYIHQRRHQLAMKGEAIRRLGEADTDLTAVLL